MSGNAVEAIRSGWLELVIDQQQWLQGYIGVLQLCLRTTMAFAGLHIDTGAGFATKTMSSSGTIGGEADSLVRKQTYALLTLVSL